MTLSYQMIIWTILLTSDLYHSYRMNIVTMVKLRTDRQTDTGEFRFLDPILNSLGNMSYKPSIKHISEHRKFFKRIIHLSANLI
jgi:hypothetical protein